MENRDEIKHFLKLQDDGPKMSVFEQAIKELVKEEDKNNNDFKK